MSARLICDSGSSKSDWWVIEKGRSDHLLSTIGYNPYVHDPAHFTRILNQVKHSLADDLIISEVNYYGAGASLDQSPQIKQLLQAQFPSTSCKIHSDVMAVAHALGMQTRCWLVILGTGSNVAHYNGREIDYQRESLGWFWGDEGSARQITRAVIRNYCRRQFDSNTMNLLNDALERSPVEMKRIVLDLPPLDVISDCSEQLKDLWSHPAIRKVSESELMMLLNDLIKLQDLHRDTVHLSGSVAYFHRSFIRNKLEAFGIKCGDIVQYPIHKLIKYHVRKDQ